MKNLWIMALAVLMVSGAAWAQNGAVLSGEAQAKVWVEIVANIAVGVETPYVDIGQVASGKFCAPIVYRVDANLEQVCFYVIATDLYKGDDPNSPYLIPVCTDTAVDLTIPQGNEKNTITGGGDNKLAWLLPRNPDFELNGFSAAQTETSCWESSQGGHFSQPVTVVVCWDQEDPELPTGEYSGWVKLVAMLEGNEVAPD